jgi:ribulose-phosphate 3-epimerase
MINRVSKFLDDYINAGSDIITFHLEIEENLNELINKIKGKKIKVGIAIKPNTPWEEIKSLLHSIDQVIVMTVEPGFGGQSFMASQIDKIKNISNYVRDQKLNVDIEIDGGVNYETGKTCIDAGANILVAGSFLFKQENLLTATNKLNNFFN